MNRVLFANRAGRYALFTFIALTVFGNVGRAEVICSNLNPDGRYASGAGSNVRGCCIIPDIKLEWAVGFVAADDTRLETVELALQNQGGASDAVEIQLLASDAGSPGNLIESFGVVSDLPDFGTSNSILILVTSSLQPLLEAGTEYFVAVLPADPETETAWNNNRIGANGGVFLSADDGPWSSHGGTQPALRVSGTQCMSGRVNAGNGLTTNVLFINGVTGGSDRTVEASDEDLISVTVLRPTAGGNGRFVLHANLGNASEGAFTDLPFDIGTVCYPFLLSGGADPVIIANNIGKTDKVGESHFFGGSSEDPDLATTTLFYPNFPVGTVLTFQGVIIDPASLSSKGASATNGVTLEIVP